MSARVDARTYPLGLGTIAVGTSGYVMSGLLPSVSTSMTVSSSAAGQLATVFALVCGATAPVTAAVTGRWRRRPLLAGALMVAAAGNVMAAVADTFPLLVAGRVVTALGAAAFTPAAAGAATALNRPEQRAQASAVVFVGLALAVLLGVPAAGLLGGTLGFRGVFYLIGGLCVVAAAAIAVIVPELPGAAGVSLRLRLTAAAHRGVVTNLVAALLACASTGTLYTYFSPVLSELFRAGPATISVLLAVFGAGGVLGTLLGGRISDRYGGRRTVLAATAGCVAALTVFSLFSGVLAAAAALAALWGGAYWALNPPFASWLIDLAPSGQPGLLLPLGGSAIYLGTGAGGLLGGLLVAGPGVAALAPVSAALAAAACLAAAAGRSARPRTAVPDLATTDSGAR